MGTDKNSDVIYHDIGMQYTKINDLFRNLNILKRGELKTAIKQGEITVDATPVAMVRQKVSVGQVVRYKDIEVQVNVDEGSKRDRIMYEKAALEAVVKTAMANA